MISLIAKFLKVLNSEGDPGQISAAFCLGMIAGFTPLSTPHNFLVLFAALLFRVNLSGFILAFGIFSGVAYILDPLFSAIGLAVLKAGPLEGLWTAMYNTAIWRIENFNNSVVMGSLVFCAVLVAPAYFVFNRLILKYRDHVLDRVKKLKIMQALKASKLFNAYQAIAG